MKTKREPYIFQIGFDFGTAYSKCVIRDLNIDNAFVYIPKFSIDDNMPFLFPSAVCFENGFFSTYKSKFNFFAKEDIKLNYLKLALEGIINRRNVNIIKKYQNCSKPFNIETNTFVFLSTVFFLAKSISDILTYIKFKFQDYGKNEHDMVAINMCIPVYCANEKRIELVFAKALNCAWNISTYLTNIDKVSIQDLIIYTKQAFKLRTKSEDFCYIYPEVSANMQGFVRSRVSQPGTYLFSDIGAGTVDQCIFIFDKTDGIDKVAYISADVFLLGSSIIERKSLSNFFLLSQNKKDIILSNIHELIVYIKSKLLNNKNKNFKYIDITYLNYQNDIMDDFKTRYVLLYILQFIKENRELFDKNINKLSSNKKINRKNNKMIRINTKDATTSHNVEIDIIDDLLYLITEAINYIKTEVDSKTNLNFQKALKKIPDIKNIKLIFGGGGVAEIPYQEGVRYAFYSNDNRKLPGQIPLPKPYDLDAESHWIPRLSVAYGLSFSRFDLHKIILPRDITPLKLTYNKRYYRDMISKDEC